MDKTIRKTYQAEETKHSDDDSRTLIVKISTNTPDRSNDVMVAEGADMKSYMRNPVVALNHNYMGLSIAKSEQVEVKGDHILAKVKFPDRGVYALADTVHELYKGGFMNAWSIGFIPGKSKDREKGGREYTEWELLEFSAVLVPDNPEALTLLRSKGYEVKEGKDKKFVEIVEKAKTKKKDKKKIKVKKVKVKKKTRKYILDSKTREAALSAIDEMKRVTETLRALIKAEPAKSKEKDQTVINLVEGLRMADKTIGIALRNYKSKVTSTSGKAKDALRGKEPGR